MHQQLSEVASSISTDKNFKPIVNSSQDSPNLKSRDRSGNRPFPKYKPMNDRSTSKYDPSCSNEVKIKDSTNTMR
jgi:hypothetical protein